MSARGSSSTRRCRPTPPGTISISSACCTRPRASSSPASSTTWASGRCAWRSPTAIRSGASSSPATPPTAIRPTAASASTAAWRTRSISAGSSPRGCRDGAATRCCAPTARSGGRSSTRSPRTSSPRASATTREFYDRYNPNRDRAEFEQAWNARKTDLADRALVYEPGYEGSPVVIGPPGGKTTAHGQHSFKARSGHHLPPQQLSSGRNVFEELGPRLHAAGLRRGRRRGAGVRAGGARARRAAQGGARQLRRRARRNTRRA